MYELMSRRKNKLLWLRIENLRTVGWFTPGAIVLNTRQIGKLRILVLEEGTI